MKVKENIIFNAKANDMSDTKGFSLYHFHNQLAEQKILVSYKGPFNPVILKEIGQYIVSNLSIDENLTRKLFKMFIEMAQNISFYSKEENTVGLEKEKEKVGSLVIRESDEQVFMTSGNLISNKSKNVLKEKCELINSMNREGLRKYKIEQRSKDENTEGGNIGLVTLALTSRNPLELSFDDVDDEFSFLTLTVKLNK